MKYADLATKTYEDIAPAGKTTPIAFDLDGVLSNTIAALRRRMVAMGIATDWETPPSWNTGGWLLGEREAEVDRIFDDPTFYGEIEPFPDAKRAVDFFKTVAPVAIITSRPDHLIEVTADWLMLHGLEPHRLIFTKQKGVYAQKLGVRVMFEDNPKHLEELAPVVMKLYRPDYPFNQGAPGSAYTSLAKVVDVWNLAGAERFYGPLVFGRAA